MALRHLLVQFPFSGPSGNKNRPAVVLSTDTYHLDWDELLVVAITSKQPKTARPTDYFLRGWQAAGLTHPSWVRSHLATVHRVLISHQLGMLATQDLQMLEGCLRIALGL